ncbi:MAG: HEAT repeat domain-containing protein [Pontiellaceae bacterium]
MKQLIYILLTSITILMLASCSRTLDDISKWESTGNHLKLIEALEDSDPSIGIAAAEALGTLQTPEAILPLAACLNQTNKLLITTAVQALAHLEHPNTITPLTAALRLEQPAAQAIAIEALGAMKATGAIPILGELISSADAQQKMLIITVFEEIASPTAAPYLIDQLKQGAPALQAASAQALGQTGGKGAVEALIKTLASDNRATTQAALTALIKIGKEAVHPLIQALRSESQQIRNQTLTALRKMEAVPTRGADSIWFRLAAAAQQLKEEIEPALIQRIALEKWTGTLLDAAAHPNKIIRNHAVTALEKMGKLALDSAFERAEALNLSWFEERNSWPGAPSWRIDLWGAISALHPTRSRSPNFQIPQLIEKLESPETRANSIQTLQAYAPHARLPLIAALNQTPLALAEQAALLLSEPIQPDALQPLMQRVTFELDRNHSLVESPLNEALQRFNAPEAEEVLTRIRPNTERALRCFERHFTNARAISAEKIETKSQQQERYRIGYISTGRVEDFTLTFIYTNIGRWIIQPELPNQLP